MERKIGEIFEYNGEWYQCVPNKGCNECAFHGDKDKCCMTECTIIDRSDSTSVVFMKLEKVGEPYEFDGHIFQSYHTFAAPIFTENYATIREFGNNSKISIEIKQSKEDMEEKNNAKHSNSEKIGKNLKPFSLEEAKLGKPVCTRDGRKARVICFDRKHCHQGHDYPIVALISEGCYDEFLCSYTKDGLFAQGECYNTDLMMLPEKKEGWAKVRKDINLYDTK